MERVQHLWEHGRRGEARSPASSTYGNDKPATDHAFNPTTHKPKIGESESTTECRGAERSGSPGVLPFANGLPAHGVTSSEVMGPASTPPVSSAERVAKELTRIECRIGRCTWKLAKGPRVGCKVAIFAVGRPDHALHAAAQKVECNAPLHDATFSSGFCATLESCLRSARCFPRVRDHRGEVALFFITNAYTLLKNLFVPAFWKGAPSVGRCGCWLVCPGRCLV